MTRPWAEAIGWALTGRRLGLASSERGEAAEVVAALAAAGWDAVRVQAVAAARRESDEPWPFPPESGLYAALDAPAAYHALLAECERLLQADGTSRAVLAHRPLNRDEQRLMVDLPPHFGHAG